MARDIGGYFEKMTRKARGGRRLDSGSSSTDYDYDDGSSGSGSDSRPSQPSRPTRPTRSPSGGSLKDLLKDVLGKGKSAAQKTSTKVRETTTKRRPTKPATTRRDLPPEGVVTIEYSPQMDGDPDPGEVVWTWVPFEEDPEQGKDRPVVVIGRRGRNLVGVPLTTKRDEREAQIALGTGDWDPKRRQSYARIWRMLDIDLDKTRREGAVLDRQRFEQVVVAVDQYYDVRRPARASGSRSGEQDFDFDY